MLRELQTILNKNTDAMNKAEVIMVTGMGVIKTANKTVKFPTANTDKGVYFVQKEKVPTGLNCARGNLSDYEEDFVNIKANEFIKLITPLFGERYANDSVVVSGLTVGDYLTVNSAGKFVKSTDATKFSYGGIYDDAGHTLYIVQVIA